MKKDGNDIITILLLAFLISLTIRVLSLPGIALALVVFLLYKMYKANK